MDNKLTVIGIAGFVVIDVVLVVLAWQHTHQEPDSAGPADIEAVEPTASPADHPEEPGQVLASLGAGGLVVQVPYLTPPCDRDDSVTVSLSDDAGASFSELEHPELTSVSDIRVVDSETVQVIGSDGACNGTALESTDRGETWQEVERDATTNRWSVLARRSRLGSPSGRVTPPCPPASLAAAGEEVALLLCRNGDLHTTDDGGETWTPPSRLPGEPVGIATASPTRIYGLSATEDCGALLSSSADSGQSWTEAHCAGSGGRGIAVDDDTVVVLTADGAVVSRDEGATWERP